MTVSVSIICKHLVVHPSVCRKLCSKSSCGLEYPSCVIQIPSPTMLRTAYCKHISKIRFRSRRQVDNHRRAQSSYSCDHGSPAMLSSYAVSLFAMQGKRNISEDKKERGALKLLKGCRGAVGLQNSHRKRRGPSDVSGPQWSYAGTFSRFGSTITPSGDVVALRWGECWGSLQQIRCQKTQLQRIHLDHDE